ncbi:MAG: methylmalonyl-CoA mutase, N-terminal domain, partial [Mycobacterium sp.]|nr:methylmalonyl-CoA mutase, N-terminal domain [Mycobacterium sp.]
MFTGGEMVSTCGLADSWAVGSTAMALALLTQTSTPPNRCTAASTTRTILFATHIADNRQRLAAGRFDVGGCGVHRSGQAGMGGAGLGQEHHVGALLGRRDSDRESDAPAAARDHDGAIGEQIVSHLSPLAWSSMWYWHSLFLQVRYSSMDNTAQTPSGIPLQPVYGPADRSAEPPAPGEFPFTRGNFASGYRGKLWTFRQYSGFGTAEESNRRYRYLLEQGGTGLSVALDLPTQCGYDSDDPEFGEEVGRVGVAVDTLADFEILFDGIPLDKLSTSMTINGTAAILLAFYVAAAERKGVPREKLTGTIQNDILKEYASRGTWIWPPEPSLRLIADTIEFCAAEVPRFNAISVAGAHFRDAGANAVQEMAFTLADGVTYCDTVVERGRMTIDQFAPQISFFFYTHGDFFEEIAKYRAGRRRWATIVKERYGATTAKAAMFRFGCVCGGASLYAPQAHNNIVRVAYEAMAAVLGGVQSMFTAAWDEPFALPTEETTTLALRTQQILAHETGV